MPKNVERLKAEQREERRQAARAQATHQIKWDVRGVHADGMLVAETGFAVTALCDAGDTHGEQIGFVPVDAWANNREQCAELRTAGYAPLGFGFVRAA